MNGIVVVDKPEGRTSYDVVREVRKILNAKKAGHTGTLDPMATGVLPVCLNEATKLVQFLSGDSKDYLATMLLGVETDTLDIEGQVLSTCEPSVREEDIEEALKNCMGSIKQIPPRYSAVKFQGKALYHWARRGISVELPARNVEIHRLTLLSMQVPYVTFFVSCSKGTYIRSLCADLGERLGCKACLSGLRRTRSGRFLEDEAISLEDLRSHRAVPEGRLISMVEALSGYSSIHVDKDIAAKLKEGCQPFMEDFHGNNMPSLAMGDMVRFIFGRETLVAVGEMLYASKELPALNMKERFARIVRVFNR
jgi:tRNA pseudouridine55 synthase